jgi:DNA-binding response OmpR family regulator
MPRPQIILLADNNDSQRETCEEFFRLRGYQVVGTNSPETCQQAVESIVPHLVILDQRMRDDTDEHDDSGLQLAQTLSPRLPKLILTAFPTWELTRAVLTADEHGLPPAAFLVSKLEGVEVLHGYVKRAFDKYVALNWELAIGWQTETGPSLAQTIEPALAETYARTRGNELEDLFCRLFLDAQRLIIKQLVWQRAGRLALQVQIVDNAGAAQSWLVVSGLHAVVAEEIEQLRQQQATQRHTQPPRLAETIHYAGAAFVFSESDLVIDRTNQSVWVNGIEGKLDPRPFELLCFLYQHACTHQSDAVCSRREIIEDCFGYEYDKFNYSQEDLVDQNIHRIREAFKAIAPNEQFLITKRGKGFRLKLSATSVVS